MAMEGASLEQLRELTAASGPLAARWCAVCDKHYRFCKCVEPDWKLRNEGQLGPLPGEPGGPETMTEFMGRHRR